ncbi:winged helix-turn-helix domain-containing protein [Sabulibacter ruber]|uniref:winged helix-turn-helix domain-containing protein n=1 Tax=Sabulibacter ruber TaxID=2811901 RepID=UPI001A96D070|nr:winged helix-turn-helix domain-containing protein [Sabulibacter ruber]
MTDGSFTINNRFRVIPSLNLVLDTESGQERRLEPRLMQLLCILSANEGKLVTREELAKEIWQGYGGADEGLNQAVSFLRKALHDSGRVLIETVPKKGYILHGSIAQAGDLPEETEAAYGKGKYRRWVMIACAVVLVIAVALLSKSMPPGFTAAAPDGKTPPQEPALSVETAFPDLSASGKETYLNTIETIGSDGTRYRLFMEGDRRPEFYVNDSLAQDTALERYSLLISSLKRQLWERREKPGH